ncbi:MAG: Ldh family oxidoreductase [Deltaproteobacteria bacterium]|nr:Ldh family oxidoreductase [Deltaproteobacteria bacterium]
MCRRSRVSFGTSIFFIAIADVPNSNFDNFELRFLPHKADRVELSYCRRLKAGGINPRPNIRSVRENAGTALVDGDHGMGHVIMTAATQLAIRKTAQSG